MLCDERKSDHNLLSLGKQAPPQSPPINDKIINRRLLIAAIKILKHIRPRHGYVLMLSRRLWSRCTSLEVDSLGVTWRMSNIVQ